MRIRKTLLIAGLFAGAAAPALFADPTTGPSVAPATQPAVPSTQPADPAVQALIDKLADPSAAVREEASKKLAGLGKSAVAMLRESANSDDPELRARVRTLLRRAERRLPPAAPQSDPRFRTTSTSISINNGNKTIDVNDNGHKIRIEQADEKIKMDVTGVEDGKEVTETYEAKDADELKKDNPEAYALYDKWNGNGNGPILINGGAIQGRLRIHAGALGGVNGQPPAVPQEGLERIREMLKQQVQQGNLPAEQQQKLLDQLNDVERMRKELDGRLQERMKELDRNAPEKGAPRPPEREDAPDPKRDL